jgi:putative transposase
MPRRARLSLPGIPWHIIQRGNNRSACFFADADYRLYLRYLGEFSAKFHCALHAYVLMTNHVHLLATPRSPPGLPKMMQAIGRVYVQYFNGKYRRTGTLWEGRYKAAIVDDERYLLTCMRYIELNPVRARMVASPGQYAWSSFRANACGDADELVSPHTTYARLAAAPEERQRAYRTLFRSSISEEDLCLIRDATQHAWALGNAAFRMKIGILSRRAERLPLGRPRSKSAKKAESRG